VSTSTEALGFVPTDGRGSLPFILLRNEPLVSVASWATGEAEVELLDFNVAWVDVAARGLPLLLHDPLCPLTPPHFLRELIERAEASGTVTVGVHEVTDTVKEIDAAGTVGDTVARDRLWQVASPVVLPSPVGAEQTRMRWEASWVPARIAACSACPSTGSTTKITSTSLT